MQLDHVILHDILNSDNGAFPIAPHGNHVHGKRRKPIQRSLGAHLLDQT